MTDPTKLTNQPSLTTSTGRIWLVVGGLFSAISLAVLVAMLWLGTPGVAVFGILAVAVLYAGMVGVRFTAPPGRLRLGVMATLMLISAAVVLSCVIIVFTNEWNGVRG